jgi:mRNA interferase MazF
VAGTVRFKSGDIIVAANPGDYGKPRPCLVLQAELFDDLPSVTFCMITSALRDDRPLVRITISPTTENGLHQASQIAIDKILTLPIERISKKIGTASDDVMQQVTRALVLFLGIS